jgi:hypothetical protein
VYEDFAGPDIATPGGKQIHQLHAAAARFNFYHVITKLPPSITYIFENNPEPDCRARRLLIGRTTTTCTWAVLRIIQSGYNKGATIVGYFSEPLLAGRTSDGSVLQQMPVGVTGQPFILQAANRAPFSVFAGYGDQYHWGQAFRALGMFVQYVFLLTGKRDKVVADEAVADRLSASVMEYWISGLKALDQGCEYP